MSCIFTYIAIRPWTIYNINMQFDVRSGSILFKHTIDENPNPNEERFKPHKHEDTYELFYFISGDANFNIDGKQIELRNGFLLLIKPGIVHNLILKSNKPYERITIRFADHEIPRQIRAELKDTDDSFFVRNTQLSDELMRLDVHYSSMDEDWILYTFRNSLNVILSYLVNYHAIEKPEYAPEDIKNILEYLDDNLFSIDSISTICNDLHMSRSALCKKFTDGYGIPIMTYVRVKRCLHASTLIDKGAKPTEIYKECGFNDYPSFYRAYKKYLRRPPSYKRL